jgi:hypothetical protein
MFMGLHLEINSAKSKIRFTTERHLPAVKVLPAETGHELGTRAGIASSEPLVGGLELHRGHGSRACCADRSVLESGRRLRIQARAVLFDLVQGWPWNFGVRQLLVETRRLELLTLSLQRRCSAN